MDQDSVKLGLLMETAQTHQKLAEGAIEKLSEHTQLLEVVVRDQIQRALVDALKPVRAEAQRAVEALQKIERAANARVTLWTLGLSAVRTPSRASTPNTKVTTGSRTRIKRNNGNRMHRQTTHRAHLPRSAATVGLASVRGIEPGMLMVGPFVAAG